MSTSSTPKITYRTYVPEDNPQIEVLNAGASKEGNFSYENIHKPIRAIKEDFFGTGGSFWVAEDLNAGKSSQRVVGMIGLRKVGKIAGKLKALRVAASHRHQGIAKQLIQIAEEYARRNGITIIILGVSIKSIPALRLYEACGYKKSEKREVKPGIFADYYKKYL